MHLTPLCIVMYGDDMMIPILPGFFIHAQRADSAPSISSIMQPPEKLCGEIRRVSHLF